MSCVGPAPPWGGTPASHLLQTGPRSYHWVGWEGKGEAMREEPKVGSHVVLPPPTVPLPLRAFVRDELGGEESMQGGPARQHLLGNGDILRPLLT